MDQATVKMTALQVIFDLLLMYGLEAFNVDAQNDDENDDYDCSDSGRFTQAFAGSKEFNGRNSLYYNKSRFFAGIC